MKYNCVVVLGPTAVGKTAIGVQIAHKFNGEVISADSRQTYKGLDIGSGKDLDEYFVDGNPVPYHLIDITDLNSEYNVYNYQNDFRKAFNDITARGKLPVVVGGTGLYIDAVVRSYELLDVPENPERRAELEGKSLEELSEYLISIKPNMHNKTDLEDKNRVIKAILIEEFSRTEEGQKNREEKKANPVVPFIIGTTFDREKIWENISIRLKERLDNGLIEEIQGLHDMGFSWERLEKLGLEYRFCSLFLEGKIASKEQLYEELFIAIRQFAKRQETWFRFMEKNGVKIHWLKRTQDKKIRTEEAFKLIEDNVYGR